MPPKDSGIWWQFCHYSGKRVEFCHFPVNATFFTLNATLFSGNSWQVVANLGTGGDEMKFPWILNL
jgi:hypothetical protein